MLFASASVTTVMVAAGPGSAVADPQPICTVLTILCPTTTATTPPPTTTATTKAPTTTTPAHTGTTTKKASGAAATTTSTTTKSAARLAAGVGAAGVLGAGVIDPTALNQSLPGVAPVAPELAGTGNPADTTTTPGAGGAGLPAALGATAGGGLPNHHATVRVLLSIVALGIAGVAAAQLPVSRRRRRTDPLVDGLDVIDGL